MEIPKRIVNVLTIAGLVVLTTSAQAVPLLGPTTVSTPANNVTTNIGTSAELPAGTTEVVITYTVSRAGTGGDRWGTVSFNSGAGHFDFLNAACDFAAMTHTGTRIHGAYKDGASVDTLSGSGANSVPVTLRLSNLGTTWATSDNVTIEYEVDVGTMTATGVNFDTPPVFRLHPFGVVHTVTDFTVDAVVPATPGTLIYGK